jgi:hypothetical protein
VNDHEGILTRLRHTRLIGPLTQVILTDPARRAGSQDSPGTENRCRGDPPASAHAAAQHPIASVLHP